MINNQPICISLFTGAYGLDLGLEQAGFYTVSVVEKDKDAVKTIALNRPHLQESAIPRELEKVTSQELLEEGGRVLNLGRALLPGEIDLVTGGPLVSHLVPQENGVQLWTRAGVYLWISFAL